MIYTLTHLLVVFLARHWIVALANAGLTLCLGLVLINLIRWCGAINVKSTRFLRLVQFVYACALLKGAFYLLFGEAHRPLRHPGGLIVGVQFPSPAEVLGLIPQTSHSIWAPTRATELVAMLILFTAIGLLAFRICRIIQLETLLSRCARLNLGNSTPRLTQVYNNAISAMPIRNSKSVPELVLADLQVQTPILLGLRHPKIVIAPSLAGEYTDSELELSLRHELAHFCRGDHIWRWFILWVEDASQVNLMARWITGQLSGIEETLCDRMAIKSPKDAAALGSAIRKAARHQSSPGGNRSKRVACDPASAAVPSLLGKHFIASHGGSQSVANRLSDLLAYSLEIGALKPPTAASTAAGLQPLLIISAGSLLRRSLRYLGVTVLVLVLLAVLYAKYRIYWNVN